MKLAIIFLTVFLVILGIIGILYVQPEFKSAFEADQQCHYQLRVQAMELERLGCDHDLETNQWLLYQEGINDQKAKVIERFSY